MLQLRIAVSLLLLSTVFFSTDSLQAQIDVISNYEGRADLIKRNALVDEFIRRFNFEDLSSSTGASSKRTRILSMFDKNYLNRKEAELGDLIDKCVAKSKKADYHDTNWFAKVRCNVTYKGRKEEMYLYLSVETEYPSERCRWVLAGADADFLNTDYSYASPDQLIPPSNHEVGFSALTRVFKDNANIAAYSKKNYNPDYLSLVLYEVKNRNLSINSVQESEFYFTQVEDWIFKIAFFNRQGGNSGWLISQAVKVRDRNKKQYLYDKLHIAY